MTTAKTIAWNKRATIKEYNRSNTHDKHNAHDKPAVSRGAVNQKPSIFVLKKFDQSDCSVSLGKWCHRDDRDTT